MAHPIAERLDIAISAARSRWRRAIAPPTGILSAGWLVLVMLVGGANSFGWLDTIELLLYDGAMVLRGAHSPDLPVVLVGATDDDLQKYGWPLPDRTLADVIDKLGSAHPVAIGVDIYRDHPVGAGADILADTLRHHKDVVFVSKLSSASAAAIDAPEAIRGTSQVGFSDMAVDNDGIIRRALLFADDGGQTQFSFALRLALRALAAQGIAPRKFPDSARIQIGATAIRPIQEHDGPYVHADAGGYQILVDFKERTHAFRQFSISDLIEGRIPRTALAHRVVIVGTAAQSVKDFFSVPSNRIRGDSPALGIEVHAHIVTHLIRMAEGRDRQMLSPAPGIEFCWLLAVGAGAVLAGWRSRQLLLLLVDLIGGTVLICAIHGMLASHGMWVAATPILLVWLLGFGLAVAYAMQGQYRQRQQLMSLFSRYFSRDVANEIWNNRSELLDRNGLPAPQQLVATILVCDLAGFTAKAEVLSPPQLTRLLNGYFELAVSIIHRHGGSIDKFIGDAVMAVFGVPLPRKRKEDIFADARHAVRTAIEFAQAIDALNQRYVAEGLPAIAVRIGIHTGPVVAGSIGSNQRMEYTVIGDTVNIAARLEGLDKAGRGDSSCRILISETTRHCLDDSFTAQPLGEYKLHGKLEAVVVYHVPAAQLSSTPEIAP